MYESQIKEAIIQRMLDNSPPDIDKRPGSITQDLLSPPAIEFELAYAALGKIVDLGYVDTAYGEYLDRKCLDIGMTRKPAEKAIGQITFTGTEGLDIPAGTEVSTGGESPILFVTLGNGKIASGSATVWAEAKEGGANGNVALGGITLTLGDITGISSVTNAAVFDGGADIESDASLMERYLDRMRKPITSGNIWQYRDWAKSQEGISDAKVYPVWNGPGTVKVVLLDEEKTAPPQPKVDDVAAYIESVRPVGATVTVLAATEVPVNVSAKLTLTQYATLGQYQIEFEPRLRGYLSSLAFTDPVVRYTQISKLILDSSLVSDYSDLTVNGATGNVVIEDGSVATPGTVTLT